MRKSLFILYLILQTICSSVFAQSNYPIYVTPTLTPPYSLNLSDYSQFGSQKLMVTVHANDLDISNLPIKLRIKLETVGVTIENPPTIVTTPIYVNGGETTILYGRDLLDYFNIDNLIFRGYSKNSYSQTGQLPEGFYKFTVEVLHFNTNRLISNQGSASAWFALGKPPLLKLPENNAEMGKFKGMPLSFSWLSSNVGSPVSANTIQYKFEMWEMHVPGINPNTVALTMPVFHEYTTLNTVYTLYPDNLLMTPGMQYAWRITASDLSGYVPFEQNGHSEIRTFVYKAACDSITNLESSHRGRNGYFSWEPKANHTSFNIELKNPETNWFSNSETFENKAEFFDLDYSKTYQMRVQAVCDGDPDSKSDFSEWKTLKIPVPEPPDTTDCPDCACDDDMPDVELQNFDLRKDLQPGDILSNKTGTSRFIIKTVEEQGDGVYKGIFLFWAEIWNIKFICNYWDLQVNTDNVIVNMDFESIYDPQFLVDVDATVDYLDSIADVVTTLTEDVTPDDTLTVDGSFETIYVNEGDSVIIVTVDDDGNITEEVISDDVDEIEEFLIEGEDGEEYVITRDGQVMDIDEYRNTGGGNSNKIDDYNEEKEENELSEDITVDFKASASQKYGFDQYNEEKSAIKNKYPSFNNGYTPTYKSVASFGTDLVGISNSGENIIFKDEMGIPALKSGEDLTLRGSVNGSDVALYAYQVINDTTEKIAGKLNVLSFDQQYKRLYIVPVNGATVPDETALQEVLNKIYGQAVTRWEVTKLENLDNVVFEKENMTHGGTSAISVYNNDQKTIVNTFEERVNTLEKDAYYLFFVENVTFKERSIAGYMPLQYQVGFIYDNPNLNIIAHELSHGAFNLYHTFSPKEFIATEHTTENLMDYKGGTELWKHQWQKIQSPQNILFGWSQDEEEGEAISDQLALSILNKIRCAFLAGESAKILMERYEVNGTNLLLSDATVHNSIQISTEPKNLNKYIEIDLTTAPEITINENPALKSKIVFKTLKGSYLRIQLYDGGESKVSKLLSYLTPSEQDFNIQSGALINLISSDETSIEDKKDYLNSISDCGLAKLNVENRKSFVNALAFEKWVSGNDENILIRLFETIPNQTQAKSMIDFLEQDKTGLVAELDKSIDDENRARYYSALIKNYVKAKGNENLKELILAFEQITSTDQTKTLDEWANEKVFFWLSPNFIESLLNGNHKLLYDKFTISNNGDINFTIEEVRAAWSWGKFPVVLQPFDLVRVDLKTSSEVLNTPSGTTIYIPAVGLSLLEKEQWEQEMVDAINVGLIIGGTGLIATTGRTALIAKSLQQSLSAEAGLILEFIKTSYKLFLTGYITSSTIQMASNYAIYEDWEAAIENIDQIDAVADGMLSTITLGTNNALILFKNGPKTSFYRLLGNNTASVFTIEFTKATFNYSSADAEIKSLFNNDIDAYQAFCNFTFSMLTSYTTEQIQNIFIKWSTEDITNHLYYNSLSAERKALANKIDAIVKSDGFKNAIKTPTSAFYKLIDHISSSKVELEVKKEVKEVTDLSFEDFIKEDYTTPIDNVNIQQMIIIPE